jgi:hypothetical protein
VVVVGAAQPEFAALLAELPAGKFVIDLVGISNAAEGAPSDRTQAYDGIAW